MGLILSVFDSEVGFGFESSVCDRNVQMSITMILGDVLLQSTQFQVSVLPSIQHLLCFLITGGSVTSDKMERTWKSYLEIQKFRRAASYFGIYCLFSGLVYAYTNNTTRAGISRADQFYSSYPAGVELLSDTTKLYKSALGNVFEEEEWGPVEFSIMAKHFQRQNKAPYAYHAQYMVHLLSNGQLDGTGL